MNVNNVVHPDKEKYLLSDAQERFHFWWAFSEKEKLHHPEHVLPLAKITTNIDRFNFEYLPVSITEDDLKADISRLAPWAYQFEFPRRRASTLGKRDPREWTYHRYRASLLIHSVKSLLGDADFQGKKFIDVACHCGPFAIELAVLGAKAVTGIDLREENIRQAEWLANVFGVENVEFKVDNARNMSRHRGYDIAFCGGLLYHLTFPTEFMRDLYDCCSDFVIFDSMAHSDPFSGFHLVVNRDVSYSAEGETHYELHPTYRAIVDMLLSVGFENIIEVVGTDAGVVPNYQQGVVKSFFAFKPGSASFEKIKRGLALV